MSIIQKPSNLVQGIVKSFATIQPPLPIALDIKQAYYDLNAKIIEKLEDTLKCGGDIVQIPVSYILQDLIPTVEYMRTPPEMMDNYILCLFTFIREWLVRMSIPFIAYSGNQIAILVDDLKQWSQADKLMILV